MLTARQAPEGQKWVVDEMHRYGYINATETNCIGMGVYIAIAQTLKKLGSAENTIQNLLNGTVKSAGEEKNVRSLFDCIEKISHPERHIKVPMPTHKNRLILLPKICRDVTYLPSFTGAYTSDELTKHFSSLREVLRQASQSLTLLLINGLHAITVTFNHEIDTWFLGNGNRFSDINRIYNNKSMAIAVNQALNLVSGCDVTIFSTTVFTTHQDKATVESLLATWKQDKTFIALHTVNEQNAKKRDANNDSWLSVFCTMPGNVSEVEALLTLDAKVIGLNDKRKVDNGTPIYLASLSGDYTLAAMLLKKGGQANIHCAAGRVTPLMAAAEPGCMLLLIRLLAMGADPNAQDVDGSTALHYVVSSCQLKTMEILLQQLNINLELTQNVHGCRLNPLELAEKNSEVHIYNRHRRDVKKKMQSHLAGHTPAKTWVMGLYGTMNAKQEKVARTAVFLTRRGIT